MTPNYVTTLETLELIELCYSTPITLACTPNLGKNIIEIL